MLRIGTTSLAGNVYIFLAVDKASKLLFTFPKLSKRAEGVARHLLQFCLTFGTSRVARSDGGGEFQLRRPKTPLSVVKSGHTVQSDESSSRPECGKTSRRVDVKYG